MNASTILIVFIAVALFAAFAGVLAWVQQYMRPASAVHAKANRRRRPF